MTTFPGLGSLLLATLALFPTSVGLLQDKAKNQEREAQERKAQERKTQERKTLYNKVKKLIETKDVYAAIDCVYRLGDDQKVLAAFGNLIFDLHDRGKATDHMLALGRAGIDYAMLRAVQVEPKNPERAKQLKYAAKVMATNLASFTWPGWNEKGIRISTSQLRQGREAAKLSVRYALELKLDDAKLSFTLWFLGAHLLAAKKYARAIQIFTRSREHAIKQGKNDEGAAMNLGYIGIAQILDGKSATGEKTFGQALAKLEAIDNEDAAFYAKQLREVRIFFGAR